LTILEGAASKDYLTEVVGGRHGLSKDEASTRAPAIACHLRAALQFCEQAQTGPKALSFLPGYYACLNLLKVYILLGPHWADLKNNSWHGVTYRGKKDSRTPMTEVLQLGNGGAIPLFYRTVSGSPVPIRKPAKKKSIKVGDLCSRIQHISAEYSLASGKPSDLCDLKFAIHDLQPAPCLAAHQSPPYVPVSSLKVLRGFPPNGIKELSVGVSKDQSAQVELVASHLCRCLLYHPILDFDGQQLVYTAVASGNFLWVEELPITLLFYYLSSVVRYNPQFLSKMKDSRFWFIFLAFRRHGLLQALTLAWSHLHQQSLIISSQ